MSSSDADSFKVYCHEAVPRELLEPVLEDPFDDTPRLIVADWYDEHAEPELKAVGYGDRIRNQIADGSMCYVFVKTRKWNVYYQAAVRRGFVDEVRLLPSAWMGTLCLVCRGKRLEAIETAQTVNLFSHVPVEVHCKNCNSTGWVDGIAQELCSRFPLTKLGFEFDYTPTLLFSYHWNLTGDLDSHMVGDGKVLMFDGVNENTVKGLMSDAGINVGRHFNNLPLIDWRKVGAM